MAIISMILTVLLSAVVTVLCEGTPEAVLRNIIMIIICAATVIYAGMVTEKQEGFAIGKFSCKKKYYILYMVQLVLICGLPFVKGIFMPLPSFAAAFVLAGGFAAGMVAYLAALFTGAILGAIPYPLLCVYMITGLITGFLYHQYDEKHQYSVCNRIIHTIFLTLLGVFIFLYEDCMNITMWVIAVFAVVLNWVLLYEYVKTHKKKYFPCYDKVYEEITNQNYDLLVRLKTEKKESYLNTMHIARLSCKVAKNLEMNELFVKAGSYYAKINDMLREGEAIPENFPQPLLDLIEVSKQTPVRCQSKEAAVIMLSASLVNAITGLKKREDKKPIQYKKLVETVINKRLENGQLDDTGITAKELRLIRKYYMEEELYYNEFLH